MAHRKYESGNNFFSSIFGITVYIVAMASYGSWRVLKLKQELRERGAVTTGRKKDLVDRLVMLVTL